MGNYASLCTSLVSPTAKASKVIFPGGEVRQFRRPVKVAELMLDSPNSFLVNTKSLNTGKRFTPLSADDDLEFGHVYIMFPMRRLKSVVTRDDMARLFMVANPTPSKFAGAGHNKVRAVPESPPVASPESDTQDSRFSFEGIEGFYPGELKYKLSVSRSRKPLLDTITEEPARSW
ncbi:hypothetical protein DCAR_0208218 [Daucus carota subsp. sativus]|uniref:Uncharacterized protein n=1 Tax=Daucus carota subsp. sativus TaxID=79200 RepID=A0A166EE34_DAUCS|nr:PREDICTED: uncharacterized protein LOC108208337 [Daucus carota subsp. sativus]WOG88983.1 hypothetical protein DCAR_0208218 [Daucus carota subsp. sativus]